LRRLLSSLARYGRTRRKLPAQKQKERPKNEAINDPLTISGQQVGAILIIKRNPPRVQKLDQAAELNMIMAVGDCGKVLDKRVSSDANGKEIMDLAVRNSGRVLRRWFLGLRSWRLGSDKFVGV